MNRTFQCLTVLLGLARPPAILLITTALLFASTAAPVTAGTIVYSNFGPDHAYSARGYNSVPVEQAESFVATKNLFFDKLELPMTFLFSGSSSVIVNLMSDAGGHPGTILESFAVSGAPLFPSSAIETLTSTTHTPLKKGTKYWVVVAPAEEDTAVGWMMKSSARICRLNQRRCAWSARAPESDRFARGCSGVRKPSPG
jgi:hypothetical protein